MRKYIGILFICLIAISSFANKGYFVSFKDKNTISQFDPNNYFDPKAIENKLNMGLPLFDWYDLPVDSEYVSVVSELSDSLGYQLRWFNGVTVYCSQDIIQEISKLSFVKSVKAWEGELIPTGKKEKSPFQFKKDCEVFNWQLNTMGGEILQKKQLKGKGIRIAIIDVGFFGADKDLQLKPLFDEKRVVDTWDFIKKEPINFNKGENHGTYVTSFVAGKIDSFQVGHAPEAEILLAKMQTALSRNKSMEEAWIKAVEWSHQKGARIVNSSVGYTGASHTHTMLTGDSCKMSIAGNLAARKGLLVVSSAANEATNSWHYIGFPADADSVLTVGAISNLTGVRTNYSSYGPTKDLRLKPNVTSIGNVYLTDGSSFKQLSGTSFSSPLVAGYAACILQNQPDLKPMELMDTIQKSSTLYPYFDYSHGYGVPRASLYFGTDTVKSDTASVILLPSPRHLVDGYYYFKYNNYPGTQIFYQIVDAEGFIREYHVIKFDKKDDSPKIMYDELGSGEKIRVFHRGTYIEEEYR